MTPAQIRTLDGTALTRLAWELGLHGLHSSSFTYEEVCVTTRNPWMPHVNLAQADVVFRAVRALGWTTQTSYNPLTKVGGVRCVHGIELALHDSSANLPWITAQFAPAPWLTEAHALTLVSVLAVASQQGTPWAGTRPGLSP